MFSFFSQPRTPSFPLGLVIESDVIIRSVETGFGRLRLVEAVISVDAYLFWLCETWPITLRMQKLFSGCTVLPDSKVTNLESSNQEASPSRVKNTGVVVVPCHAWKCVRTAISGGVDISKVLSVVCFSRWAPSEGQKSYFKDWCLINLQSNFLYLTYI